MRELVQAKRRWSSPPDKAAAILGFQGWHERGYLPHRDEPGLIQFVSFRLVDSFPAPLRSEWEGLLAVEDDRERRAHLEAYLDKGRGACFLRDPRIAAITEQAIRHYHGHHYDLRAWVVMPNHVHLLLQVWQEPLGRMMGDLKRFVGRQANLILGRKNRFWAPDSFDTYMRDRSHEEKTRRYIEANPVKAGLAREPAGWPRSSARFRKASGVLELPGE